MTFLAPAPLGVEALDDPRCPPDVARTMLRDIRLANALFGGRRAAVHGFERLRQAGPMPSRLTLLEVGAGAGDVALAVMRRARAYGTTVVPIGLDSHRAAAELCRRAGLLAVTADAAAPPVARMGVDLVLASQLLHHFSRDAAITLIGILQELARIGVIVCDARRTRAAAAGIWLAATALRFHPVTRRDGVLSVRRSFSPAELADVLRRAGVRTRVHRRPGFRLVAAWRTDHEDR